MDRAKQLDAEIAEVQREIRDRRRLGQPTADCFSTLRQLRKELREEFKQRDARRRKHLKGG